MRGEQLVSPSREGGNICRISLGLVGAEAEAAEVDLDVAPSVLLALVAMAEYVNNRSISCR